MEPEGSLPHSQVPATCPYPEPARSSPCPTSHFLGIHLNIILPPMPGSSKCSLSLRFPHQNPVYASPLPIPTTCPAHLILLDLITRTIFGEEYRSLSSSICSFLHSPVTSSLVGPNNLLNTLFSNTLRDISTSKSNQFCIKILKTSRTFKPSSHHKTVLIIPSHKSCFTSAIFF